MTRLQCIAFFTSFVLVSAAGVIVGLLMVGERL